MINVCRLCLSFTSDVLKSSDIQEIKDKIRICFSLNLISNNNLPIKVCIHCTKKINDSYECYNEIVKIEENLLNYLLKGDKYLQKYLESLNKTEQRSQQLDNVEIKIDNCTDDEFDHSDINSEFEEKVFNNLNNKHYSFANKQVVGLETKPDVENSKEIFVEELKIKQEVIEQKEETSEEIKSDENDEQAVNTILESKFKCLTCFKKFQKSNILLKHYYTDHLAEQSNYLEKFTVEKLDGKIKYICKECQRDFPTKKRLKYHAEKHSIERPLLCKICGRTFRTAKEIVIHGKVHDGVKKSCQFNCGFSSVYPGSLKNHEMRLHHSKFKYQCKECGKGFFEKTTFSQHQNVHKGIKPFVCEVCNMAFHMERYLKRHRMKHPEPTSQSKRNVCLLCLEPFDTKHYLQAHMATVHKIKQSYLCDTCGKSFKQVYLLTTHKKTHETNAKRYSCSLCEKSFKKNANLSRHYETHSGLSHDCAACGKKFTQNSSLNRHLNLRRCEAAKYN